MQILKIILNSIIEFVAKLELVEIIVIVILFTVISIILLGLLKGELTQWTFKCYDFLRKKRIAILVLTLLIYIIIKHYELADLIAQSQLSQKTELHNIKETLAELAEKINKK